MNRNTESSMKVNQSIPHHQPSRSQQDQKATNVGVEPIRNMSHSEGNPEQEVNLSNRAQRIKQAQAAIANQPVVDPERVNEVREKFQQNTLALFSGGQDAQNSALNIADKLLSFDSSFDLSTSHE